MLMWILSNISVSWYPLSLKGCVECFPKMQSSHLPPMVSSSVIFRPSTNILTAISWIVSGAACPNLQCHVSKVAGHHFVCDTNAVGVLDVVSIVYRQPHRLAIMITVPLTDLTCALCWSNSTFTPFAASLDTEIRLERSSGMCSVSVTNFIQPYLHQFSIDSHGLNGYGKPLKRPFDRYQSRLKAINDGRDIRQINW